MKSRRRMAPAAGGGNHAELPEELVEAWRQSLRDVYGDAENGFRPFSPSDAEIREASEAAEGWLTTVQLVSLFGPAGAVDQLYPMLMPGQRQDNLLESYNRHVRSINAVRERFAVVSDGYVKWEVGRGWSAIGRGSPKTWRPLIWDSAHEASAGIARMALGMLVVPLNGITHHDEQRAEAEKLLQRRWKALEMTTDECAEIEARVRRERAKLLNGQVQPKPVRLQVDLEAKTLTLDGTTYPVSSERALRWVRILAERSPDWVSSSDLSKIDPDLLAVRTDKFKASLPKKVRDLITSRTGAGSCIRLT